jgi:hypothetical protein
MTGAILSSSFSTNQQLSLKLRQKTDPRKNGGLFYSYTIKKIGLSLFRAAARRAIRRAGMRAVRAAGLRRLRLLCHCLLLPVAGKSRRADRQQANKCQFHQ